MSRAHRTAAVCLLGLLLLQWVWHALLAPPTRISAVGAAALFSLPLLPALALYWRGHRHAAFWAAVIALFYFSHGVMEAWSAPGARSVALVEAALAATLVVASSWDGMRARFTRR